MKRLIIAALVVLLIGGGYYLVAKHGSESPYTVAAVSRRDIAQTVSVTGTVQADPRIDLQFQASGQIENIYVKEGQSVKKDTLLAELENDDLAIRVSAARANLDFHEAILEQEIAGAKNEDVRIAKVKIDHARQDLKNAKARLNDVRNLNQSQIAAAELKVSDTELTLNKSKNDLEYAERKYDEDIADANNKVKNAEIALENAKINLQDVTENAEQKIDDAYIAIETVMETNLLNAEDHLQAVDNILGIDSVSVVDDDKILLGAKDPTTIDKATLSYKEGKRILNDVKTAHNSWKTALKSRAEVENVKNEILRGLEATRLALDDTFEVLENSVSNERDSSLTNELKKLKDFIATEQNDNNSQQDKLKNAYQAIENALIAKKTNMNSAEAQIDAKENDSTNAKTNVSLVTINAQNTVTNAGLAVDQNEEKLKQAKQSLEETRVQAENEENSLEAEIALKEVAVKNAEADFEKVVAKPRDVDLKSLKANVDKAVQDTQSAKFSFEQTQLKAPTDGVIVSINKELGENITASEVMISVNAARLLLSANVSETDIAKVQVSDAVTMTFDAFDFSEEFKGTVVEIAPAETVIEGVIYYEVKVSFEVPEAKAVKTGMTANMKIATAEKEKVLAIPLRAVKFKDQGRFVQVLKDGKLEDKPIQTGLEGDQYVEVVSGLKEGEEIVTFVKQALELWGCSQKEP